MEEGSVKTGGWKGLPFYTRVTIAGLFVVALIITGIGVLTLVSGGGDVEDAVQGIVFYGLFMIPTVVVVVLAWRRPELTLVATIWAMLGAVDTRPSHSKRLGHLQQLFRHWLVDPRNRVADRGSGLGYPGIPTTPSGRHPPRVHGRRAVGSRGDNGYRGWAHGLLRHTPPH